MCNIGLRHSVSTFDCRLESGVKDVCYRTWDREHTHCKRVPCYNPKKSDCPDVLPLSLKQLVLIRHNVEKSL